MRAQVELLSKQQGAGKSREEPGELARTGSGLEEGCKMEFDEETEYKKQLDEQKNSLQRQLREIEKFANMDPVFRDKQKEVWKEELEEIEIKRDRASAGAFDDAEEVTKSCKVCGISRRTTSRRLEIVRKKCKRSTKSGRKGKHSQRRASKSCRKGRATLGRRQQSWKMRSRTCRQVKREEAAVRRNPMDAVLIRPFWINSSRWEQPKQCSSSPFFMEKSAEYMAVNIGQSQLLRSEAGAEEKEAWEEEEWGRCDVGGMRVRLWLR